MCSLCEHGCSASSLQRLSSPQSHRNRRLRIPSMSWRIRSWRNTARRFSANNTASRTVRADSVLTRLRQCSLVPHSLIVTHWFLAQVLMFYWFSHWIKEENSINTSCLIQYTSLDKYWLDVTHCYWIPKICFLFYYPLLRMNVWSDIHFN